MGSGVKSLERVKDRKAGCVSPGLTSGFPCHTRTPQNSTENEPPVFSLPSYKSSQSRGKAGNRGQFPNFLAPRFHDNIFPFALILSFHHPFPIKTILSRWREEEEKEGWRDRFPFSLLADLFTDLTFEALCFEVGTDDWARSLGVKLLREMSNQIVDQWLIKR